MKIVRFVLRVLVVLLPAGIVLNLAMQIQQYRRLVAFYRVENASLQARLNRHHQRTTRVEHARGGVRLAAPLDAEQHDPLCRICYPPYLSHDTKGWPIN